MLPVSLIYVISASTLGILVHMSDSVGERVVLLTQPKVNIETHDVKVVHYRGVKDDDLIQV